MLHSSLSAVVEFPFSWVFFFFFKYCDGFCHSTTWIGHRHSCVPNLLPHPIPPSCHRTVALDAQSYIKLPRLSILHMVGLACCDSWSCKESDMTERLKWTELNWIYMFQCDSLKSCYPISFVFLSFSLALFSLSTCCDRDLKFNLHFFSALH